MFKKVKDNKGFTLVELIVVMAVLAVISAIAVPRFLGVQEDAKVNADYATGAMLGKAAELYFVDDKKDITTLNSAAAGLTLQSELKTSEIKFVSKKFEGKEGTIFFTKDDISGAIKVEAKDSVDVLTQLYPK